METFRKIALALSIAAFAVCGFLEAAGGIGIMLNSKEGTSFYECGIFLIISACLFAVSLITAFFRKTAVNIISLVFNAAATAMYIYTLGIFNGVPNSQIPKQSMEVITSRIYPSIAVTILLAAVIFADYFSYDRSAARAAAKNVREKEKNRSLKENEKII